MPGYPGWLARPAGAVLLAVLWLACAAPSAAAAELVGRVVSVADGDTLTLLHGRQQVKVRLTEIDAPERGQPFGKRATRSLSALCGGKTARVVLAGTDRYQRTLGRVWCQGVDTSAEQVRRGLAWVYDQYVTDPSLYALQNAARRSRAGLWTEPAPVPPWLWRQGVTAVTANGQPLPPAASNAPSSATAAAASTTCPAVAPATTRSPPATACPLTRKPPRVRPGIARRGIAAEGAPAPRRGPPSAAMAAACQAGIGRVQRPRFLLPRAMALST